MATMHATVRSYKNVIVSVIIILFCIAALFFAIIPAVQKTVEVVGQVHVMKTESQALQTKLTMLESLSEDTLKTQLATALSAVPADRSFSSLFDAVEGIANQAGVSLVDMSISQGATLATPSAAKVSASDKQLGTRTIPFTVTVTGSLRAIEQFITIAPTVRRLLRIRLFSLSFPKIDQPISIGLDMDGFYEPLPVVLGSDKSVLPTLTNEDSAILARLQEMPLIGEMSDSLPPPVIGKVKENPFSP